MSMRAAADDVGVQGGLDRRGNLIERQIDAGKGSRRDDFNPEHGRRRRLSSRRLRRSGRCRREPQRDKVSASGNRRTTLIETKIPGEALLFIGENPGGIMTA